MWRNPVWYYAPVCEFHNTQCEDGAATRRGRYKSSAKQCEGTEGNCANREIGVPRKISGDPGRGGADVAAGYEVDDVFGDVGGVWRP